MSTAGSGAVDHPSHVVRRAVGEGDPQAAPGQRLRVPDLAAPDVAAGRHGRARGARRGWRGLHPVPYDVPAAGVLGEERARGRSRPAAPTAAPTRKRSPSTGRSPVAAGGPPTPLDVLDGAGADLLQRVAPVARRRGSRPSWSWSACVGGRDAAAARHRAARPGPARLVSSVRRQDDVDHGEARADEQHVARPDAVAAYDVEGAGGPRVGHEERRGRGVASGAQSCPAAGSPVATTTASATSSWPSSVVTTARAPSSVSLRQDTARVRWWATETSPSAWRTAAVRVSSR